MSENNQVIMSINSNEGYSPEQITSSITLAQLLEEIQIAIEEHGAEASVVLANGQRYGAGFGSISYGRYDEGNLFTSAAPDDDDED